MCEERDKVRCQKCELVQWRDRETCRRCGASLAAPVVKIVERVVERIVFRPYALSIAKTEGAVDLRHTEEVGEVGAVNNFPTMAEMERMMILAAYQRSIGELSKLPGCSALGKQRCTASCGR